MSPTGFPMSQCRQVALQGPLCSQLIPCLCKQLALLAVRFMLVSWLAHSSTLKIDVTSSSETNAKFQWTRGCWRQNFSKHKMCTIVRQHKQDMFHEDYYPLWYDAVQCYWWFQVTRCLHVWRLLYPENRGSTFLWNVSSDLTHCTISHPRKQQTSVTTLRTAWYGLCVVMGKGSLYLWASQCVSSRWHTSGTTVLIFLAGSVKSSLHWYCLQRWGEVMNQCFIYSEPRNSGHSGNGYGMLMICTWQVSNLISRQQGMHRCMWSPSYKRMGRWLCIRLLQAQVILLVEHTSSSMMSWHMWKHQWHA
jgi:hypothetical protein